MNTNLIETARPTSGDGAVGTVPGTLQGIRLDERAGGTLHKDLGDIAASNPAGAASGLAAGGLAASGLAAITINRTKSGIDPFTEIVKTPTYSEHSGTHSGYSVEIEDPKAETGYRHVGTVSKSYLLLSNAEVRELAVDIARRSGLPFRESRIFWDGSRFCHVVDFLDRRADDLGGIGLSLVTRSSYDRSWKYECALMGKRFVCDNGAISGEFFARVSFRHRETGPNGGHDGDGLSDGTWQEVVRQGMSVVERAPADLDRFVTMLRRLKAARMTDARLREVWRSLPEIGDSIKGQVLSRYVDHEEASLFGLLQAGTWLFSHREKMNASDFSHNDAFTSSLLRFAEERLN